MIKDTFFSLPRFMNLCRKEMVESWKSNVLRIVLDVYKRQLWGMTTLSLCLFRTLNWALSRLLKQMLINIVCVESSK